MTDHLAPAILNALADGELTGAQLAQANEHLATCPACTTSALHQSLLKSATARAGHRYAPPPHLQERLMRLAAHEHLHPQQQQPNTTAQPRPRIAIPRSAMLGWATAAVLLLACTAALFVQRNLDHANLAAAQHAALVGEVFDQHVATLANPTPPQVLSTDRHTVKPWFQGKLPFSFNLPDPLPSNTTLDGANLTYLRNQPVAQLLYSIGKHRVSIFISQKPPTPANPTQTDRAGFHVIDRTTASLEIVAISDVDPARLAELATALQQAQTPNATQSR
jgi:anti-sigma factor RsiW